MDPGCSHRDLRCPRLWSLPACPYTKGSSAATGICTPCKCTSLGRSKVELQGASSPRACVWCSEEPRPRAATPSQHLQEGWLGRGQVAGAGNGCFPVTHLGWPRCGNRCGLWLNLPSGTLGVSPRCTLVQVHTPELGSWWGCPLPGGNWEKVLESRRQPAL